jgi:hypothetical protein
MKRPASRCTNSELVSRLSAHIQFCVRQSRNQMAADINEAIERLQLIDPEFARVDKSTRRKEIRIMIAAWKEIALPEETDPLNTVIATLEEVLSWRNDPELPK